MAIKPGLWIVVEGIDGAGKTSALTTVIDELNALGFKTHAFREPGGTAVGEEIRTILKKDALNILPLAEVLLFYAARFQLLHSKVLPLLAAGDCVVLDRFELSTYAYQAGGRGCDIETIKQISSLCLQGRHPDLTIFLAVSPEVAYERICARGELDHIEQENLSFFSNVAAAYEQCLAEYPNTVVINANQAYQSVQAEIRLTLQRRLQL